MRFVRATGRAAQARPEGRRATLGRLYRAGQATSLGNRSRAPVAALRSGPPWGSKGSGSRPGHGQCDSDPVTSCGILACSSDWLPEKHAPKFPVVAGHACFAWHGRHRSPSRLTVQVRHRRSTRQCPCWAGCHRRRSGESVCWDAAPPAPTRKGLPQRDWKFAMEWLGASPHPLVAVAGIHGPGGLAEVLR